MDASLYGQYSSIKVRGKVKTKHIGDTRIILQTGLNGNHCKSGKVEADPSECNPALSNGAQP